MSQRQDKRRILADVLSGKLPPDQIPGEGCIIIEPGTDGLVNVDGKEMNEKQAKRAINRAETILFFEGDDDGNELFNELSANPSHVIDFNNDDDTNEVDNE